MGMTQFLQVGKRLPFQSGLLLAHPKAFQGYVNTPRPGGPPNGPKSTGTQPVQKAVSRNNLQTGSQFLSPTSDRTGRGIQPGGLLQGVYLRLKNRQKFRVFPA